MTMKKKNRLPLPSLIYLYILVFYFISLLIFIEVEDFSFSALIHILLIILGLVKVVYLLSTHKGFGSKRFFVITLLSDFLFLCSLLFYGLIQVGMTYGIVFPSYLNLFEGAGYMRVSIIITLILIAIGITSIYLTISTRRKYLREYKQDVLDTLRLIPNYQYISIVYLSFILLFFFFETVLDLILYPASFDVTDVSELISLITFSLAALRLAHLLVTYKKNKSRRSKVGLIFLDLLILSTILYQFIILILISGGFVYPDKDYWLYELISGGGITATMAMAFLLLLIIIGITSVTSSVVARNRSIGDFKPKKLEKITFTAGYPNIIRPNIWYSLFIYFHLPKFQNNVKKILDEKRHQQGIQPAVSTTKSFDLIERGTMLKIVPSIQGITFNPASQEIAWHEDIQEILFRLKSSSDNSDRALIGSIDIYKEELLIGQLPISIKVSLAKKPVEFVMENSKIFEQLFVSYSHKDAPIVDQCILAYKALGIKVNIDKASLRSGEKWRKHLIHLIERSDVFQLYWSKAASGSLHVQEEWEHALALLSQKGEKFIRPCYWEIPMPEPPIKLEPFHFERLNIEKLEQMELREK